MKNIRIWFKKTGTAKYISHLDLCRCMERAIHRVKLPFWYTEGFNPHIFLTINMPISLGYTGEKECMDVKLLDDDFSYDEIIEKLNAGLPIDVKVYEITEVVMKPKEVAYAEYNVHIENKDGLAEVATELQNLPEIIVEKRTKKGMKNTDIKPFFDKMTHEVHGDELVFNMTLPSSNSGSINPRLFFDLLEKNYGEKLYPQTSRLNCFNTKMEEFK